MKKTTFALYFGNRGFFPGELIASARKEMTEAVTNAGYDYIVMDEKLTKYGAVELRGDGIKYAAFLKEHTGEYEGVILCLPNFGDENGAVAALKECGVPILVQAYPDELDKMDFSSRRDAFCGKLSIMDVFYQYGIKYTAFQPHVIHPLDSRFQKQLHDFAAICRAVQKAKHFTVGAIGARTTPFKTVRFDELALQKSGITVETFDLSALFLQVQKLKDQPRLAAKVAQLRDFTDFSCVPEDKMETLAKVSLCIDDLIAEYQLDAIALRCWNELQEVLGISPCVLLGELIDRGIPAACELDVCNAAMMYVLSLASGYASTCLDWNNNYGDDPDKCILFHCGPVPQSLMEGKGKVTDHKMFAKSYGTGCGFGSNEGRIAAMDFTYASAKTENGKLHLYTGKGRFTGEPIEEGFFGCGGVAEIKGLQNVLTFVGKNGYRHHVSVTKGDVLDVVKEVFDNYLGYDIMEL